MQNKDERKEEIVHRQHRKQRKLLGQRILQQTSVLHLFAGSEYISPVFISFPVVFYIFSHYCLCAAMRCRLLPIKLICSQFKLSLPSVTFVYYDNFYYQTLVPSKRLRFLLFLWQIRFGVCFHENHHFFAFVAILRGETVLSVLLIKICKTDSYSYRVQFNLYIPAWTVKLLPLPCLKF